MACLALGRQPGLRSIEVDELPSALQALDARVGGEHGSEHGRVRVGRDGTRDDDDGEQAPPPTLIRERCRARCSAIAHSGAVLVAGEARTREAHTGAGAARAAEAVGARDGELSFALGHNW